MNLTEIKGLGKVTQSKLSEASIYTVEDLLLCFPKSYKDQFIQPSIEAKLNEATVLKVKVLEKPSVFFFKKNLTKLSVKVQQNNLIFRVDIFNRQFLANVIRVGEEIIVTGKFKKTFKVFTASELVLAKNYEEGIIPQYHLNDIKDGRMRKIISEVLKNHPPLDEVLPDRLLDERDMKGINQVIKYIHQPKNYGELSQAIFRLKYEELIRFALRIELIKQKQLLKKYSRKTYDIDLVKRLINQIEFELTNEQKQATNDIFRDLKSSHQMNRLLQGDVGSGKTIVSVLAAYASVTAGYQVSVMAPTLVLSHQHEQVFNKYLKSLGVRVGLLTSELSLKKKREIVQQISQHEIDIVIGTHALIQEDIAFDNLGFVIIDEQHRFGVEQRKKLREKGYYPDLLLMSATPIPRSLAISIFESSDVSQITEKPKGRKKIVTKIFSDRKLNKVFERVMKETENNHQIYVICPLIEESDVSGYYSVEETLDIFKLQFPQYNVESLHGKMTDEDKRDKLDRFRDGKINILISTTVIEVGIHVDNATTMIIMNGNAFGLAQLHQLRGRIGRSELQSYCYLIVNEGSEDTERLSILENEDDGFIISAYDLKLRGPGEVFGKNQAGVPHFNFANLIEDDDLLQNALSDAREMIDWHDSLSVKLKNDVIKTIESYHLD